MYDQGAKCQTGGSAGVAGICPTAEKQGQVQSQINESRRLMEILHSSIEELSHRVSCIVRQEPVCGAEAKEPCLQEVGLAADIREQNKRMGYAIERINSLIERCEL
jgi:hypothetical protein